MADVIVSAQEILNSVKAVPALSTGASHLLDVMGGVEYEVADIVRVIESDSALTANVLKVINSAAVGMRREVNTVHEAVAFLGETKVIGIALASSGGDTFNKELKGYQGDRGDLGRHCLWTAIAARELAKHTNGLVNPGVAFTSGLLHDIGKVVISDFMADVLPKINKEAIKDDSEDYVGLERLTMGTDHCEVGCALARRWKMPEALVVGIQFHHSPDLAPEEARPMAYIIHLADMMAMMQGIGTGADDLQYTFHPGYVDYMKLEHTELEALSLDVQIDFNVTAEALFGDEQETE